MKQSATQLTVARSHGNVMPLHERMRHHVSANPTCCLGTGLITALGRPPMCFAPTPLLQVSVAVIKHTASTHTEYLQPTIPMATNALLQPTSDAVPPSPSKYCTDLCNVIRFLQDREAGVNLHASLRIENPDRQLLEVIYEARDPMTAPDLLTTNPLCQAIGTRLLQRFLLRTIPTATPPVLVLRPIKSPVHGCIEDFLRRCVLGFGASSRLTGLLTSHEIQCIWTSYSTWCPLPRGRAYDGDTPRRMQRRALPKEPEIALSFSTFLQNQLRHDDAESSDDDDDDDDNENNGDDDDDNNNEDNEDAEPESIAPEQDVIRPPRRSFIPSTVILVGYWETYDDLLADCTDYLVSSEGHIKLAIILYIEDCGHPADPTAPAAITSDAGPHQPSPRYYTAEEFDVIWDRVWSTPLPVTHRLNAFMELWEYDPAQARPTIKLRTPRIPILNSGKRVRQVKVPMRRSDFGFEDDGDGYVDTDWRDFGTLLNVARKRQECNDIVEGN
ncbi:hypothetical protein DFH27DRAFT_529385 [Peziza echinospora]|nr:hypothetical protein DFH27DRAFT_529385 [Peziza echinospora]